MNQTPLLQIGARELSIPWHPPVAIGPDTIVRDCFQGAAPSALELENAIARIEDALAPLPKGTGGTLATMDGGVRDIARVAGITAAPDFVLDLAAVERVFNRVASVADGSTHREQDIPDSPTFTARVLILRELMHHLGYVAVIVRTLKAA